MEVGGSASWKEQFRLAAEDRREDILWQARMARLQARQEEQRATRVAHEKREAEERAAYQYAFADREQVVVFTHKLDRYDAVTVEALMENRVALDAVRDKLDTMLMEAHVLPDGRRVFKTQDGTRVFDEHGTELKADAIDPNAIDDGKPKWETYKGSHDEQLRLELERKELLDFQSRADSARVQIDKDGVTTKELDDLGADLDKEMPDAVRRKLAGDKPEQNADVDRDGSPALTFAADRDEAMPRARMSGPAPQ